MFAGLVFGCCLNCWVLVIGGLRGSCGFVFCSFVLLVFGLFSLWVFRCWVDCVLVGL